jgi:hypothetical protein
MRVSSDGNYLDGTSYHLKTKADLDQSACATTAADRLGSRLVASSASSAMA